MSRTARRLLPLALAALLALPAAHAAWSRDWRFFRSGFEQLIAMHCKAKWVVRPEHVGPCVAEQRAAMLAWTGAMSNAETAPERAYFLSVCRSRWSAVPHTNWVRALACAEKALADLHGRPAPG